MKTTFRFLALAALASASGCKSEHPESKLELIERAESAIHSGSEADFMKLFFDPALVDELCPSLSPEARSELKRDSEENRQRARAAFRECSDLVDWSESRRLALNYGRRAWPAKEGCYPEWQELEDSEMYYAVGERVYKVKLYDGYRVGQRHGILRPPRCVAKRPDDKASKMEGFQTRCRAPGWPAVTQATGTDLDCD